MHHINHSPRGKVFKRVFALSMVAITLSSYISLSDGSNNGAGEEVIEHEIVQSNESVTEVSSEFKDEILAQMTTVYKPLYVMAAPLDETINILVYDKVESETKHEDIKEEEETGTTEITVAEEPQRENTLYYVNDNGYKSYLAEEYQDHLYAMCIKYDVEEYYTLFLAQMYHESTFRTDIISKTNDHGLMQINVCNHEWLGERLGNGDFLDPYNNIEAGVLMMSEFLHEYNDEEKALVCYNKGESAVINGTYSTAYSRGVLEDMNLLVELD